MLPEGVAAHPRRATLFVGGLALDALAPSLASGADLVVIDLEDAVPPSRKDEARDAVFAALASLAIPAGVQLLVRVNTVGSPEGAADLRAVFSKPHPLGALMLPKVESADEVLHVADLAEEAGQALELYPIIETTQGLESVRVIARAHARLTALFFGGFDLSTALGCEMAWEPLLYARSRVVHAGASAGIEVLDSPFPDVGDLEGLARDCRRVKALGMAGKAAKHASQVAVIRDAFTPSPSEVERAKAILALFDADPTRPLIFEGKLVELPAVKRLRRIAAAQP
jgi:(S)-citramalyl-CoA lyase